MAIHSVWLDTILKPEELDQKFIESTSESELFDLLVHLINNGISLLSAPKTAAAAGGPDPDDAIRKSVEGKKFNTIRYAVFKVLSHFGWDLHKIIHTLPCVHQEFAFTEFNRFCEQEEVPTDWKNFAVITYHRWVLCFILKSIYPTKPAKIGMISANQQLLDPYYIAPETKESLAKKLQSTCHISLADLENILTESEPSKDSFPISRPQADCFELERTTKKILLHFDQSTRLNKVAFFDDVHYELGRWSFIHEDYAKASHWFRKISTTSSSYKHLEGYRMAAEAMNSPNYRVVEPKEDNSLERRITRYLQTIIKEGGNVYELEPLKASELKKVLTIMRKFHADIGAGGDRSEEEQALYSRLTKYLIFKLNGLYEALDSAGKAFFLSSMDGATRGGGGSSNNNIGGSKENAAKNGVAGGGGGSSDGEEMEDVIEEGEIDADEEQLTTDDDAELMLLEAIEPYQIQSLVTSVAATLLRTSKSPLSINNRWTLPDDQTALLSTLTSPDIKLKCHMILAKAKELRRANYFSESRTLYVALIEDIQALNQTLADIIRYELLHTDLEIFFQSSDVDERMMPEMEKKCLTLLMDSRALACYRETFELACVFLLNHGPGSLKEYASASGSDLVRFCASLASLVVDAPPTSSQPPTSQTRERAKEFWELLLLSYNHRDGGGKQQQQQQSQQQQYSNSPLPFGQQRSSTSGFSGFTGAGLEGFIGRFTRPRVISLVATAIAKVYNNVKDNTSPKIALSGSGCDLFPGSIPSAVLATLDLASVRLVLERTLRRYIDAVPGDLTLLRYLGDYLLAEELYSAAMRYFVRVVMIETKYFADFQFLEADELIVHQMIVCSTKSDCHVQAAVLYQLHASPDYGLAFKELNQALSVDSADDLYDCIWDVTLLEYLINHHHRRNDMERKLKVTRLISQLDLNVNNGEKIQREAANLRKNKLFRMLAKQYM